MVENKSKIEKTQTVLARVKCIVTHQVARKSILTMLDQVVVSGVAYVIMLMFTRLAPQIEYGTFVMVLTVFGLGLSIQAGIVTGPLSMLVPTYSGGKLKEFVSALLFLQVGVGLLASLCVGVYVWVLYLRGGNEELIRGMIGLCFVFVLIQFQEFCRRTLMACLEMKKVLINDCVFCVSKIILVGCLILLSVREEGTALDEGYANFTAGNVMLVFWRVCCDCYVFRFFSDTQFIDLESRIDCRSSKAELGIR